MIKKILIILGAIIILISPLNGIMTDMGEKSSQNSINKRVYVISLPDPDIIEGGNYVYVKLKEVNHYTIGKGAPMLPVITKTLTFPLGYKIMDVKLFLNSSAKKLDKKITPSIGPMQNGFSGRIDKVFLEIDDMFFFKILLN